ncbi:MAG: hypothetical protein U1C74_31300, partial [Phenylobacterium sp.]|nr:hypothetical protein [Phenylobacterium sp.]
SRCYTPPPVQAGVAPPLPGSGSPGPGPSGAARPGVAGADAPVRALYRDMTATPEAMARWFTAGYRALEAECGRAQGLMAKRGLEDDAFGQCGEDASSLCQCQDMDDQVLRRTLALSAVPVSPGVARVEARFRVFADGDPITVPFRVVRTAQGWLIDDISHASGEPGAPSGERALFLQGINTMRKTLRLAPMAAPPLTQPAG